jgi:hypothetical protein
VVINSGLVKEPIFVIEGEDFDYDSGLTNPEGHTADGMPCCTWAAPMIGWAVEGVDYNNGDAETGPSTALRPILTVGTTGMYANNNAVAGNGLGENPGLNS